MATLPAVLPFVLGVSGSAVTADASLSVTATETTTAKRGQLLAASLAATAARTAVASQTLRASLAVTASRTTTITKHGNIAASLSVTDNRTAVASQTIKANLAVTAAITSAIRRGQSLAASLAVTTAESGKVVYAIRGSLAVTAGMSAVASQTVQGPLAVTASPIAGMVVNDKPNSALAITASPTGHVMLTQMGNVTETITAAFASTIVRGRFAATNLSATAGRTATASQTLKANLAVTASRPALAHLHGFAAASRAITVTEHAAVGTLIQASLATSMSFPTAATVSTAHNVEADANLNVSTSVPFPYQFPFVFEQATQDSAFITKYANAALSVTAAETGDITKTIHINANEFVTAQITAALLGMGEFGDFAQLPVIVGITSTSHRDARTDAQMPITASQTSAVRWDARAPVSLPVSVGLSASMNLAGKAAAQLPVTVLTPANTSHHTILDAQFEALVATTLSDVQRGHLVNAQLNIPVVVGADSLHSLNIFSGLPVSAGISATTPEPMEFFPFYLR